MTESNLTDWCHTIENIMDPSLDNGCTLYDTFYKDLVEVFWNRPDRNAHDEEMLDLIANHRDEILLLYGGNNDLASELMISNMLDLERLCEVITQSISKNNFKYIMIDRSTEGIDWHILKCLDILDEYLTEHHSDIKVWMFTSTYNAHELNSRFKTVKLVGIAGFMYGLGCTWPHCDIFYNSAPSYTGDHRKHVYLNLNRLPKPARVLALAKLYEKDLVKYGLNSMFFNGPEAQIYWERFVKKNKEFGSISQRISSHTDNRTNHEYSIAPDWYHQIQELKMCQTIQENIVMTDDRYLEIGKHVEKVVQEHLVLPGRDREDLVIDNPNVAQDNPVWHDTSESSMFANTYFSLISETFTNLPFQGAEIKNMVFFSEKTSKAFAQKHPFLLFGPPGSLKQLHDMGFQTFDCVFDESYDLIEDPVERLDAIIDQIDKMCKWGEPDWVEARIKLLPIIEHNFHYLMFTKFKLFGEYDKLNIDESPDQV